MARYVVLAMRDSLDPVGTQMIPDGDLMAPVVLSLVVKMEEALLNPSYMLHRTGNMAYLHQE